jgi:lantibiotic modifying enzyme
MLDRFEAAGPVCGTPGAISTPGLMVGLAGIGHGLLRLGFPDLVPSVLLLDPPAPGRTP